MATYPVPVLHFDTVADAQAAVDDNGVHYLGQQSRRGWAWYYWVILNSGGPNDQSLRVIDQYADPNATPPTDEVDAPGWFCGVAVDESTIPTTLAQNLSDGAAAVSAAVAVEPTIAGETLMAMRSAGSASA